MDATALASHMASLYEKGLYTDTIINIFGKTFRVHRAILSLSGYFDAVMSEPWAGSGTTSFPQALSSGGGGGMSSSPSSAAAAPPPHSSSSSSSSATGALLEFDIDTRDSKAGAALYAEDEEESWPSLHLMHAAGGAAAGGGGGAGGLLLASPQPPSSASPPRPPTSAAGDHAAASDVRASMGPAEITLSAFEDMLRFLYGVQPRIHHGNAKSLLVTTSYFDVAPLMTQVADFVFANLTHGNAVEYLLLVHNKEYGESGKLIEDASLAYLYRNAVDMTPVSLARLPPSDLHRKLFTAAELFVQSEFARYKMALATKRATRARILSAMQREEMRRAASLRAAQGQEGPGTGSSSSSSSSSSESPQRNSASPNLRKRTLEDVNSMDTQDGQGAAKATSGPAGGGSAAASSSSSSLPRRPTSTSTSTSSRGEGGGGGGTGAAPDPHAAGYTRVPSNTRNSVSSPTGVTVRRLHIDTSAGISSRNGGGGTGVAGGGGGTTGGGGGGGGPFTGDRPLYELPSVTSMSEGSGYAGPLSSTNNARRLGTMTPSGVARNSVGASFADAGPPSLGGGGAGGAHRGAHAHTRTRLGGAGSTEEELNEGAAARGGAGAEEARPFRPFSDVFGTNGRGGGGGGTAAAGGGGAVPATSARRIAESTSTSSSSDGDTDEDDPVPPLGGAQRVGSAHGSGRGGGGGGGGSWGAGSDGRATASSSTSSSSSSNAAPALPSLPLPLAQSAGQPSTEDGSGAAAAAASAFAASSSLAAASSSSAFTAGEGSSGGRTLSGGSGVTGVLRAAAERLWGQVGLQQGATGGEEGQEGSGEGGQRAAANDRAMREEEGEGEGPLIRSFVAPSAAGSGLRPYVAPPPPARPPPPPPTHPGASSSSSISSSTPLIVPSSVTAAAAHPALLRTDKVLPSSPAGPAVLAPPAAGAGDMLASPVPGGGGLLPHSSSSSSSSNPSTSFFPLRPARNFRAELNELDDVYAEIFSTFRWLHMTKEQLEEVRADGEVLPFLLDQAARDQALLYDKLDVANRFNVKRLSELEVLGDQDGVPAHLKDFKWPGFRVGVELRGVFSEGMSPGPEGEPRTLSSERAHFAGSLWCIDLKRYANSDDGAEYVAVYLRRRSMNSARGAVAGSIGGSGLRWVSPLSPSAGGGGVAAVAATPPQGELTLWEDTRERTTMSFSIRLCGAPGAPTSNSVCGRSVMGKSFGTETEQSWGWESFVSVANLTEKPWSSGDALRFMINLDML